MDTFVEETAEGAGRPEVHEMENCTPEVEKGQKTGQADAAEAFQEQMAAVAKAAGMTADDLTKKMNDMVDALRELRGKVWQKVKQAMETILKAWEAAGIDEWTLAWMQWENEKRKMSNNERRRRGLPMVRRPVRRRRKK